MKIAIYSALAIFLLWLLMLFIQLWSPFLSAALFFKLTISAGLILVGLIISIIVIGEYRSEKRMKENDFLE